MHRWTFQAALPANDHIESEPVLNGRTPTGPSAGSTPLSPGAGAAAGGGIKPSTNASELAKLAFRRLVRLQLEPTPDNYARAYAQESGVRVDAPPLAAVGTDAQVRAQGAVWAVLTERVVRNLTRGGKQWTGTRRKESLRRVFDGSRSDAARLQQRLQALMKAWEEDLPADGVDLGEGFEAIVDPATASASEAPVAVSDELSPATVSAAAWCDMVVALEGTVRTALPQQEPSAAALAQRLDAVAQALARDGATAVHVAQVDTLCKQARQWLGQRHRLVLQLTALCRDLNGGMADLVEDGSWVQGQIDAVGACLQAEPGAEPNLRAVRGASALLVEARQRQQGVRGERQAAQDALKSLIQNMLLEVGELGEHTGRFQLSTAAHVQAIEGASSLEGLAGVVKSLLADSKAVQAAVQLSSTRLQADRGRASELEGRVRELEGELRRLSDEVSTDALTKVANRRGLAQMFEAECARVLRDGGPGLAIGLIDIDNFKKLNDTLGHAAGDQALKNLAAQVQARLRPTDHLARFGGEEFVVLIPGSPAAEAQQALTRLQRSLSEALFLHEGREVFVTFSAGVTSWVPGETLEDALSRADNAMYEAKRTGKNKTCLA